MPIGTGEWDLRAVRRTQPARVTVLRPRTLAEQAYELLRKRIIRGELPPGTRLSEAALASECGISRSPVKDALRRLAQEGLVEVRPQVGSFVAPASLERALDILEVRALLEPFAARRAAVRLSDETLADLERSFAKAEAASEPGERELAIWEADDALHYAVATGSGNDEIVRILMGFHDEVKRIRQATARYAARLPASFEEMRVILDALRRRDPDSAEQAMRRHVDNIAEAFRGIAALADARTSPARSKATGQVPGGPAPVHRTERGARRQK